MSLRPIKREIKVDIKSAKDLNDYLFENHKEGITEFRVVVQNTSAYIHPLNRDGETMDFFLIPKDINK